MSDEDAPFPEKSPRERRARKSLPLWQEMLLLLAIALGLAIVIKMFFIQAFYIPSPSMEPQFVENDRILVQKVSYWGGGEPQRGDIIVFADPGGWLNDAETAAPKNLLVKGLERIGLYPTGGHLVKRVIGVGGDRVECKDASAQLLLNGRVLNEAAYLPDAVSACDGIAAPFKAEVPVGELWVMGDNRVESADSRAHFGDPGGAFVRNDLVVGKVVALVWPWSRAEIIHRTGVKPRPGEEPGLAENVRHRAPRTLDSP